MEYPKQNWVAGKCLTTPVNTLILILTATVLLFTSCKKDLAAKANEDLLSAAKIQMMRPKI